MKPVARRHDLVLPKPLPVDGPLVDVLVPLYNDERYIGDCLESVLTQSYRSIRVIVIDDCSTNDCLDTVRAVAETDARVSFLKNPVNIGAFPTTRRLLETSTSPFVKLLASDDRLYGFDTLARLVAALESEPEIALATGFCGYIDEHGARTGTSHGLVALTGDAVFDDKFLGNYMLSRTANCIDTTSVMFRRDRFSMDDLTSIGGIEPDAAAADDIMWWLNIHSRGKVAFIDDVLSEFRVHGDDRDHQTRMKTLQWVVGMHKVIAGARNLGYLADSALYLQALASLFNHVAHMITEISDVECAWDEWKDAMSSMVGEISASAITQRGRLAAGDGSD